MRRIADAVAESKGLFLVVARQVLQIVADIDIPASDAIVEAESLMDFCQCLCNGGVVECKHLVIRMRLKNFIADGTVTGSCSVNEYSPYICAVHTVEVGLHLRSQGTDSRQCNAVGTYLTAEQLELAAASIVCAQSGNVIASCRRDVEHEASRQLFLI